MENLSLVKRESPLGGEDNSVAKADDLSNAPKLPPKPGKPIYTFKNLTKCMIQVFLAISIF